MLKHTLIALLLTFAASTASAGKMILLEEAMEFDTLNVRVSKKGSGDFRMQACDDCKEIRLVIAPTTTLEVDGQKVPLSTLNKFTLRSGTVFYRETDNVVTRIEAAR